MCVCGRRAVLGLEPNDACTPAAAAKWLQFAEWYQWPHVTYFDSPQELHAKVEQLLRDESARRTISDGAKAFFAAERERAAGHVRAALQRSLRVAPARAAPREREGVPGFAMILSRAWGMIRPSSLLSSLPVRRPPVPRPPPASAPVTTSLSPRSPNPPSRGCWS